MLVIPGVIHDACGYLGVFVMLLDTWGSSLCLWIPGSLHDACGYLGVLMMFVQGVLTRPDILFTYNKEMSSIATCSK